MNTRVTGAFSRSITDSIHLKGGAFRLFDTGLPAASERASERARGNRWYSAVSEVGHSMLASASPLASSTRANLLHPLISTWIF